MTVRDLEELHSWIASWQDLRAERRELAERRDNLDALRESISRERFKDLSEEYSSTIAGLNTELKDLRKSIADRRAELLSVLAKEIEREAKLESRVEELNMLHDGGAITRARYENDLAQITSDLRHQRKQIRRIEIAIERAGAVVLGDEAKNIGDSSSAVQSNDGEAVSSPEPQPNLTTESTDVDKASGSSVGVNSMIGGIISLAATVLVIALAIQMGDWIGRDVAGRELAVGDHIPSLEKSLTESADEINDQLPRMVDSGTRFDSLVAADRHMEAYYTLIDIVADELRVEGAMSEWRSIQKDILASRYCSMESLQRLREREIGYEYIYFDKYGEFLSSTLITPGDCPPGDGSAGE